MGRQSNLKRIKRTLRRAMERDVATDGAGQSLAPYPQLAPAPLPWQGQPGANRDAIEILDNFSPLRNKLREIAAARDEWAGIPLPIDGEQLVIEPSYPYAGLSNIGGKPEEPGGLRVRNIFWSTRWRCKAAVCEREDGKMILQVLRGSGNAATMLLQTLGCSFAWGIEQESNAIQLLATLVKHNAFKHYMLTGTFLESSARSGVTYLFRRLRPTLAIKEQRGFMCVLAALCMHPIGYYAGSWAGAMCPTDDVIAHLILMRGDEPMFWRRCSQHPVYAPEAGL